MKIIEDSGTLHFNGIDIELLEYSNLDTDSAFYKKNVIGKNLKGEILWVVSFHNDNLGDMFTLLSNRDGKLNGTTYRGSKYSIDLKTGKATRTGEAR